MFEPGLIHILPSDREMMVSFQITAASLSELRPETTIPVAVSTAFNVRDVSIQHSLAKYSDVLHIISPRHNNYNCIAIQLGINDMTNYKQAIKYIWAKQNIILII